MKKFRTALIGCGGRGKLYAQAIESENRIEIVALCDINVRAMTEMNTKHKFNAKLYTDYKEMLTDLQIDFVIICLWTPLHLPVLGACLQAGIKIIHSEKPVATNWLDYQEAGRLARAYNIQLTYGHQRRFSEGNILVKNLIKDGIFGKIKNMELYSPPHLLDCGTHTFDQAAFFIGEEPVSWVLGIGDVSSTISYFDVPAENCFTGTVMYKNGIWANIIVGFENMEVGAGVRIHGENGFVQVQWDGYIDKCVVYDNPEFKLPEYTINQDDFIVKTVANALDSAISGEKPELDYTRAINAGEIIFALYESMRRRAKVKLPLKTTGDHPLESLLKSWK